jgi:NAD-dependent dihydropyrimidine dehydrogenase PreA subunit
MWNRNGFWKQSREVLYITSEKCVGCMRCTKVCRRKVLSMVSVCGKAYATACRQEHCSQCGKCIVNCPERAIELVHVINNNLKNGLE